MPDPSTPKLVSLCAVQRGAKKVTHFSKVFQFFVTVGRKALACQFVVSGEASVERPPAPFLLAAGPSEKPAQPFLQGATKSIEVFNVTTEQPFKSGGTMIHCCEWSS